MATNFIGSLFNFSGGASTAGPSAAAGGGSWLNTGSTLPSLSGARAEGGPTAARGFYRVNENEPELLTIGGDDYLMMGGRAGHVTPPGRRASGGSGVGAGGTPPVVIYDQRTAPTSAPVTVEQGSGPDGMQQIRVFVRDEVRGLIAGGQVDSSMRARYGVAPTLTKR